MSIMPASLPAADPAAIAATLRQQAEEIHADLDVRLTAGEAPDQPAVDLAQRHLSEAQRLEQLLAVAPPPPATPPQASTQDNVAAQTIEPHPLHLVWRPPQPSWLQRNLWEVVGAVIGIPAFLAGVFLIANWK